MRPRRDERKLFAATKKNVTVSLLSSLCLLAQQWYTSTMNLIGTWLTDRMDLQLHVYQLKILIRVVKVRQPWRFSASVAQEPNQYNQFSSASMASFTIKIVSSCFTEAETRSLNPQVSTAARKKTPFNRKKPVSRTRLEEEPSY